MDPGRPHWTHHLPESIKLHTQYYLNKNKFGVYFMLMNKNQEITQKWDLKTAI